MKINSDIENWAKQVVWMKRENTLKLLFYFVFVVLFYLLPFSLLDSFALFKLCFYPLFVWLLLFDFSVVF